MANYIIISESTCDLSNEYVTKNNVCILPMTYRICDKEYHNYLDYREQSLRDFYDLIRAKNVGTTAQLNIIDIQDFWRPMLKDGNDLLVVAFSSGLSGSINAMRLAREQLLEEFPERKILIVDSLQASGGEGLLINYAVDYKNDGLSIEENYEALLALRSRIVTWFTVDDIGTLYRGGRLSGGAAVMAKFLNIKPVLRVDSEGHLQAVYKKMGRRQAINQLVEILVKKIDTTVPQKIIIGHSDSEEECAYFKNKISKELEAIGLNLPIEMISIGPVIGSHCGPGTLMFTTIGKESE